MKIPRNRPGRPGFVSYLLVLSTGTILTLLTIYTYRRASQAHRVQSSVQLRIDYSEKEDAILRSIVSITPNRAIRAMQHNSNSTTAISNPLRWENIFTEAMGLANARTSIPSNIKSTLNLGNARSGNTGDSALSDPALVFKTLRISEQLTPGTGYISSGTVPNSSVATTTLQGFPPLLRTTNSLITSGTRRDQLYPIISDDRMAVGLAQGTRPNFNLLTYPQINFGYAKPGDPFVAKRNWWAFSMNVADHDGASTSLARPSRDFVLSIYEIPSQLAISASAFMNLGEYASGDVWQNVNIDGGVFAGRAQVSGLTSINSLASRRGMTIAGNATIGGQSFASDPFTPGVRETFQMTEGEFFPVSLASESGRVAFIPINRGADFFDRFSHQTESNTVSPTTWNNYSIGALQCAMRLDIVQVKSATNKTPTALRFSYMGKGTTGRQTYLEPLETGINTGLPPGYVKVCNENQSYNFGTSVVDIAYGANGKFYFQTGITGTVLFNNARFGDPISGTFKGGYSRPSAPYKISQLPSGKTCVAIFPERFAAFLNLIGADTTAVNSSIAVNVDYTTATGSVWLTKPSIPCLESDYGLILNECSDLSTFTKGFSLVTNLRTYIGDDFNTTPITQGGTNYPPCSLFTPEKRYGVEIDPFAVSMSGQIGSLASETSANPIRPLDSKTMTGAEIGSGQITVNLRPITSPAALPPVTMMNWLVVLEERRKEFIGN
jgi:hypothetical protein